MSSKKLRLKDFLNFLQYSKLYLAEPEKDSMILENLSLGYK